MIENVRLYCKIFNNIIPRFIMSFLGFNKTIIISYKFFFLFNLYCLLSVFYLKTRRRILLGNFDCTSTKKCLHIAYHELTFFFFKSMTKSIKVCNESPLILFSTNTFFFSLEKKNIFLQPIPSKRHWFSN